MFLDVATKNIALELIRIDGGTQPRAEVNQDVVREYAQDMLLGITFPPITLFYDGSNYWLADGFHRYYAAKQICSESIAADIRQGTRQDAVWESIGANKTHGLRRTNGDKDRAVRTAFRYPDWASKSDGEIANHCGVSDRFVAKIRKEVTPNHSESNTRVGADGRTYNVSNIGQKQQNLTPPQFFEQWQKDNIELELDEWADPLPTNSEEMDIELAELEGKEESEEEAFHQQIADILQQQEKNYPVTPARDEPGPQPAHVKSAALVALQSSESNEWYTPVQYVEAARELMGGIDVDPASNPFANEKVQAVTYYDIETNGLNKQWQGRVWLNPPYGRDGGDSNQEIWTRELVEQFVSGSVTEAVLLVNANTEAKWFQPLWNFPICFTDHRIRFYTREGAPTQPTQGNAFVYFGENKEKFAEIFKQFGPVILGPVIRRVA